MIRTPSSLSQLQQWILSRAAHTSISFTDVLEGFSAGCSADAYAERHRDGTGQAVPSSTREASMRNAIGYISPRGQGCKAIYEDAAGQYVLDDEGWRVYGVYMIPEGEGLRGAAAMPHDPVIDRRLFTGGVECEVHRDDQGQYVMGPDGERVYGVWVLTEDAWEDVPVIVRGQ